MKKKIGIFIAVLALIGIFYAYRIYSRIYSSNVVETTFVYIPTGANFQEFLPLIEPYLKDLDGFVWVAEKKNYPNTKRAGKLKIDNGMSNEEHVNHLR